MNRVEHRPVVQPEQNSGEWSYSLSGITRASLGSLSSLWTTIVMDPIREWQNIKELAHSFMQDHFTSEDRTILEKAIGAIPANDREDVLEKAGFLINLNWRASDIGNLFKTIANIPKEERENVVKLTKLCFHKDIGRKLLVHCIKSF